MTESSVAASVRGGKYQRPVGKWVGANASAMQAKPTAFVSVCLAVLDTRPEAAKNLQAVADRFYAETRWQPTVTKMVAGVLLYRQYNWLTRLVMKHLVKQAGGDTDTSRDYEYTDWADVRGFAELFGDRVAGFASPGRTGQVA
jgi:menaquinone-dependent protoporphyrinogen oxidase